MAHERLRGKMRYQPIGFELLPAKFTLRQIQHLFEVVLDRPLDKRNFRKKILSMDILVELDEVETDVEHGLTSEVVTMFIAEQLEKVAPGGGDESESITVHEVSIGEIDDWLNRALAADRLVDARVYAGLYFLRQLDPDGELA